MVLPDSNRVSRAPSYLRKQTLSQRRFRVHGFHVLWLAIQTILLATQFSYLIRSVLAVDHKSDTSTNVEFSDLVVCELTTPIKYSSNNLSAVNYRNLKGLG